jgi:hypothetical protein
MLYKSKGVLRYSIVDVGYKLIVEADQGIADYYLKLIPKYKNVTRQRYPAHISIVRKEVPINLDQWGKREGEDVDFWYDNEIKSGRVYFWLNVFSKKLEEVRTELGLPVSSEYTRPPDSFEKVFHLTLGNCGKGV